jgi:hypothetical protein
MYKRTIQVKTQTKYPTSLLRYKLIATFFVMMTIVFLAAPVALSRHPGDPLPKQVTTESNRQN